MLSKIYFAVSWALVGLIWVIQLVKYPGFRYVRKDEFLMYHSHHTRSVTLIVLPLMLTELSLAIFLGWQNQWSYYYLVPLLMVLAIWLSTFLIQIPLHRKLEKEKDDEAVQKLANSNWIRTILWTAKALWLIH